MHQLVHQYPHWIDRRSQKKLRTTFSGSQVAQVVYLFYGRLFVTTMTMIIVLIQNSDHHAKQLESVFEQQKYLSSGERAALAR